MALFSNPLNSNTIGYLLEFTKAGEILWKDMEFPKQSDMYQNFSDFGAATDVLF